MFNPFKGEGAIKDPLPQREVSVKDCYHMYLHDEQVHPQQHPKIINGNRTMFFMESLLYRKIANLVLLATTQ